jgi:hypothetical protein
VRNIATAGDQDRSRVRIRENRPRYCAALQAPDRHWAEGQFDVDELADYLADLLRDQLSE